MKHLITKHSKTIFKALQVLFAYLHKKNNYLFGKQF